MPLDASAVAKLLHEFGQRTALRGGNPYRAQAYSRAAENPLALTLPLGQIVAEDRLQFLIDVGHPAREPLFGVLYAIRDKIDAASNAIDVG